MYPLPAVLVNFSESTLPKIRSALADNAVSITNEFSSADSLLKTWSCPPDATKRLLAVRLRSLEDVEQMGRVESCFPGWPLLAFIEGDCDISGLLQVSRAGAAQILSLPFERDDFDAALDRLLIQFALRETPSRVIAVSGVVEGCGATSLSISLAAELAALSQSPCVLTEMSFGIGRLSGFLNLSVKTTTRDLLVDPADPTPATVKAAFVQAGDHLAVLSGQSRTLAPFSPAPGRLARLIRVLRQLSSFVVIDMPYTFDPHYFETLATADHIFLVARQDLPAVEAAKLIRQTLLERGVRSPDLVLNQYDSSNSALSAKRIGEALQTEKVFTIASDVPGFRASLNAGRPLREMVPMCVAVSDIRTLAQSILESAGIHPLLPRPTLWERIRTLLSRLQN